MVQSSFINGRYQKYGPDNAIPNRAGEYTSYGRLHEIEVKIDLTTLTQSEVIQSDVTVLPAGVIVQEVEINTQTAAATGVAIDLGLIRLDRATEIDYDGLLAAFPTASMNAAGKKVIISDGTTYDGALIGATTGTLPGYITCSATTATAFTAGLIYLTIRYWKP